MAATVASAIEWTIESPGEPAARRLYREDVRRLTPLDGRRAMPSDGRRANPADGRQRMTPIGRHRAAPNGRSARCPLCVMRHRLWPGGIPGAPRLRKGSQARRRPAKRQRPAPTVKRVAGWRRRHAGTTARTHRTGAIGRYRCHPGRR